MPPFSRHCPRRSSRSGSISSATCRCSALDATRRSVLPDHQPDSVGGWNTWEFARGRATGRKVAGRCRNSRAVEIKSRSVFLADEEFRRNRAISREIFLLSAVPRETSFRPSRVSIIAAIKRALSLERFVISSSRSVIENYRYHKSRHNRITRKINLCTDLFF